MYINDFQNGFAEFVNFTKLVAERHNISESNVFELLNDPSFKDFISRYPIKYRVPKPKYSINQKTGKREEFDFWKHTPTVVHSYGTGVFDDLSREAELIVTKWELVDADGKRVKHVRKGFRASKFSSRKFRDMPSELQSVAERVLFNGHRLNKLRQVAISEGEKDAETIEKLTGIIGTCPFRTNHFEHQHAQQLKHIKTKLLFFDADLPGISILEKTVDSLFSVDRRTDLRIVDCGFPIITSSGKDVSDLVESLSDKQARWMLNRLIKDAVRISSFREFKKWRDTRLQS